jgi:hypothetical protein
MVSFAGLGLQEVQPNQGFEVLPAGDYDVIVVDSEAKPTKDGQGQRLNVKLQILNGQWQNRYVFDGFNVKNKNPQAEAIALSQLKSLCVAVGVPNPNDSAELHNKPLTVTLKIGKNQDGTDRNEVKSYKPRSGNMLQDAFQNAPSSQPGAQKKNPFA